MELENINYDKYDNMFAVDVEAYGQSPARGSMTEFSAVNVATRAWCRVIISKTIPNPDNPAQPKPVGSPVYTLVQGSSQYDLAHGSSKTYLSLKELLEAATKWLKDSSSSDRVIFISDNNGYDFSWVNHAYDSVGLVNPFGYSSRRIGDFAAGLAGVFTQTSKWKSLRDVSHTHESHYDAQGNVGAIQLLLKIMETVKNNEELTFNEAFVIARKTARSNFIN